jgi:phosphoesterase RecJ-like protein
MDTEFKKAVELIAESKEILITTHRHPDGDACGCCVAVSEALTALRKKSKTMFLTEVPKWYEFLFTEKPVILGKDMTTEELKRAESDLIIILDTNSYSQLPGLEEFLQGNDKPVLVIDHHATSDGLGDVELIETGAAATALIVSDLFKYARWPVTERIAHALFVGIATDTGWFQFGNTDSRVFQTCAELIEAGASCPQTHRDLYQNFSVPRFKLMTMMLNTLQLHFDGRFAIQQILQSDFRQTGAGHSDTENLVDECRKISTVEAAALFVELEDGQIRCSLRSDGTIDVRKIAQKFGGGGHHAAAGAFLPGPIDGAKKCILAEMTEEFNHLDEK